jgi:hypothetical protein
MVAKEEEKLCRLVSPWIFVSFVSLVLFIQFIAFFTAKGNIFPQLVLGTTLPPEACSSGGCRARFPCTGSLYQSRYWAEYEDGHQKYAAQFKDSKPNGDSVCWNVLPFNKSEGIDEMCAGVLTLSGWQTASCVPIIEENFRSVVTYDMSGILLFEFVFSFSLVVDIMMTWSCCCFGHADDDGRCRSPLVVFITVVLGITSIVISFIDLVVNVVKPDYLYGSVILLLLIFVIKFGWLLIACIWDCCDYGSNGRGKQRVDESTPLNRVVNSGGSTTEEGKPGA